MRLGSRSWRLVLLTTLVVSGMALAACAGGVPQADVDALKEELEAQRKKVGALQEQLSSEEQQAADLQATVAAAGQPGGAGNAVEVLIGAKVTTPAPPKPTATPLPEGVPTPTLPPAPVLPESYTQPVPVFIYADTVIGSGGTVASVSDNAKASCILSGVFRRGMQIVFRFEAVDTSTGKKLTDADVDSAVVRLPDGEEIKARFGRHGSTEDAPWFWAAGWTIPDDYPLGTLNWEVHVKTRDGKEGTFRQLQVYDDARGTESRTQIVE